MKKTLYISSVVIWTVFVVSCGDQRSVRQTAHAFLQSYYVNNDFDGAKKISTESTYDVLDFKAMMFMLNPNSESESIHAFELKRIDVRKTKAVCFYEVIGQERRLNLSKVNGKWLVDMPENATIEPGLSLSQSRNAGGFASATSNPVKLRDVPEAKSKNPAK